MAKILTERYVRNRVDTIFAINNCWKTILLQLFKIPNKKIKTIPLGADHTLFKFNPVSRFKIRQLLGLSADDLVVVYSGKIILSKELHILLKAISPIIRQNPKVKLLIIGDGPVSYINLLNELSCNLKISSNVLFYPWVHRTKLPDFYSASDIAVWPGGVSISILEAASVGLPLIIKDSVITKFAIANGNGLSFKHGKINELQKCLETLVYDPELRGEMSRKSRLLIEEKLNWESIAEQFLSAYESPN
ncbi:MAG: glycosyltransferase family 4 protein [Candidatus Bathyarchaeia archaeon]|nr:glycosyltransferase family 4 protein [Candidatus Bathyarchaeia archaeon]